MITLNIFGTLSWGGKVYVSVLMKILILSIVGTYYKLAYLIKIQHTDKEYQAWINNYNCEAFARKAYLLTIFVLSIFESKYSKWEKYTDRAFF